MQIDSLLKRHYKRARQISGGLYCSFSVNIFPDGRHSCDFYIGNNDVGIHAGQTVKMLTWDDAMNSVEKRLKNPIGPQELRIAEAVRTALGEKGEKP